MATQRNNAMAMEELGIPENQVHCWACRALVVIPEVDGQPASLFKCGWCGAINPQSTGGSAKKRADGAQSRSPATTRLGRFCDNVEDTLQTILCCECSDSWFQTACMLVVAFTSALIATIGILGIYPVLFDLTTSPLTYSVNAAFAVVLEVNIFFNYFAAVFGSNTVQKFYDLTEVPPSRGSFDNFTYCGKCDKPKPPNTHHCSACATCVVDMDHHCPYLNNCVGRGNLRHFLLFLLWVTTAMLYAIPVFSLSLLKHQDHLFKALATGSRVRRRKGSFSQRMVYTAYALISMPRIPFVSMVMLTLCGLVLVMVGMLCVRHWVLAARGATYVGSLKGEQVAEGGMISNLRYVFGQGHPLTWFGPSLTVEHVKKHM